ncbi:class I SAM-dependent methyltransferase [Zhouia sp. PK063]|uniref:class I SAM-dependent methyltransferase n=1 Tax=Zhouia sp. PK063 TaxID=3373602 RepID=UPI00379C9C57
MKTKKMLTCKDFTVSGENFDLLYDEQLDMLITSPKPTLEKLPEYYKSEDYISHTDAKRGIFEKMYHAVKQIALKQKLQYVNIENPEKGKLLDIGAGTGDFLLTAKNDKWQVSGVEPNLKAQELAQKKSITLKEDLSFYNNEQFDVITMWHVLEHVPNLEAHIAHLKKLLAKNGTIFIAVPNFKSWDAHYYKEFWAAYDVPRHLWHFSQNAIKTLFAKNELKVVKMIPMKFDAFYVSLLSEKYKTGKMNFVKGFFNGLKSNNTAKRNSEYSSLIYVIKNN